jgi:peptide deformylase
MNYKIIKNKDFLKRPTEPATIKEGEIIGNHLKTALKIHGGLGLSAPQIGFSKSVCVVHAKKEEDPIVFVNPRVVESSTDKVLYFEGCLSLPKGNYTVRNKTITVAADNISDPILFTPSIERTEEEYRSGAHLGSEDLGLLEAIVVQHELDHLDGILINDSSRKVVLTPPVRNNQKFGRNEKVMIKNPKTDESQYIKFKNAQEYIDNGWELI